MTKAEKGVLLALAALGRKKWHSDWQVTKVRLWQKHYAERGVEKPDVVWSVVISTPGYLGQLSISQYQRVTERWLSSFVHRGLAEVREETTEVGEKLLIHFGPSFRISKTGQKVARAI